MDAATAFNLTIELFKLKPSEIAQKSGIAASTISDFRHGNRDIRTSTLQTLVSEFPQEARTYFYWVLSQAGSPPKELTAA
jgi:transcriptional regulator with XRE-family HTH domain